MALKFDLNLVNKSLRKIISGTYDSLPEDAGSGDARETIALLNRLGKICSGSVRSGTVPVEFESAETVYHILDATPVGICITNDKGVFEYVNPKYCELYGYAGEELLGNNFTMVVPEKNKKIMQELHDEFMGRTYELSGEWEVLAKDGKLLTIFATAAYITDLSEHPKKVTFVVDISRLKRTEKARDAAERIIRHDMKNPVSGILGVTDLLLTDDLNDEQKEFLGMIRGSALKLNRMIQSSLDFVQMEMGTYRFRPAVLVLEELLKKAESNVSDAAKAKRIGFSYRGSRAGSAAVFSWNEYRVAGEEHYLEQLFTNLFQNAVEASPEAAEITLSVAAEEPLRITIANRGFVPEDVRGRFFEPYATSGKDAGTGMGTYIARLIARVHGGDIEFESSRAEGTALIVKLPQP
jgi:PAS domain S-box-containing protein